VRAPTAADQGFIITSTFTLDRGKPIRMTNYLLGGAGGLQESREFVAEGVRVEKE